MKWKQFSSMITVFVIIMMLLSSCAERSRERESKSVVQTKTQVFSVAAALDVNEKVQLHNTITKLNTGGAQRTDALNKIIAYADQKKDTKLSAIALKLKKIYLGNTIVKLVDEIGTDMDTGSENIDEASAELGLEVGAANALL